MAAARIGSPQSRGTWPPARSNSTSRGWRTSRTNARARAWSSSWAGVRVRSIAPRMRHPVGGEAHDVAGRGTARASGGDRRRVDRRQAGWASTMIRISVMSSIA